MFKLEDFTLETRRLEMKKFSICMAHVGHLRLGIFRGGLLFAVFAVDFLPRSNSVRLHAYIACRNGSRSLKIRPTNNFCNTAVATSAKF